jgi:hypothetical protein
MSQMRREIKMRLRMAPMVMAVIAPPFEMASGKISSGCDHQCGVVNEHVLSDVWWWFVARGGACSVCIYSFFLFVFVSLAFVYI